MVRKTSPFIGIFPSIRESEKVTGLHRRSLFHFNDCTEQPEYIIHGPMNKEVSLTLRHMEIGTHTLTLAPPHLQKKMRTTITRLTTVLDVLETYLHRIGHKLNSSARTSKARFSSCAFYFHEQGEQEGYTDETRQPSNDDRIQCAKNFRSHVLSGRLDKASNPTDIYKEVLRVSPVHNSYCVTHTSPATVSLELEMLFASWGASVPRHYANVIRYYVQLKEKVDPDHDHDPTPPRTPPVHNGTRGIL